MLCRQLDASIVTSFLSENYTVLADTVKHLSHLISPTHDSMLGNS
nr:MAG TPA: hypothetical protein [Caudoviricetes sp.]